jgi:membrane protease subunit (stomatin/prohibitin family)
MLMMAAGYRMGQAQAQQQMQAQTQQQAAVEQANQQGAMAVSAPAPTRDLTTELQKLADLHRSGVLTDEEFAAAKKKVLG